jgi:predicted phosphodiesterase
MKPLVMKIGIISDIHSNLEALTTALDWLESKDVDQIICLGDVVGYGADPNPCCELLREKVEVTLLGNHDAAAIGNMDISWYIPEARDAIHWTRKQLTARNFQWLYSLPYTHIEPAHDAGYFHAAPVRPSAFYYLIQNKVALAHTPIYDDLATWNFVGHSHLTNQYMIDEARAKDVSGHKLEARPDRKFLINVGSVGQPRDRDNRLCFGWLDTETNSFEHIRIAYDIDSAAEKILKAGLHERFANRLFVGR